MNGTDEIQIIENENIKTKDSSCSESTTSRRDGGYILHQVTKNDTIAGIAIKYGVSVFELKKLNAIHTESAIFARGTLIIPTKNTEFEDFSNLSTVAQLIEGLGRRDVQGRKISLDTIGLETVYPNKDLITLDKESHAGASTWNTFLPVDDGLEPIIPQEIELENVSYFGSTNSHGSICDRESLRRRKKEEDGISISEHDCCSSGVMANRSDDSSSWFTSYPSFGHKKKMTNTTNSSYASSSFSSKVIPRVKNYIHNMTDALSTQAQSLFSENTNSYHSSNLPLKTTESNNSNSNNIMGFFAKIKRISNQSALVDYENSPLFGYYYKRSSSMSSSNLNPKSSSGTALFSSLFEDDRSIQKRSSKLD